ncbi:MAG: hypothetical protein JNM81_12475 [Rhodospirillaceae bacterium]|nr:hypothetical protein [Rhodospirillaceae bacterium]
MGAADSDRAVVTRPDPASGMMLEVQSIQPLDAEQIPKVDPLALYGDEAVFDVYRKGSKIGTHRTNFTRAGNQLTVTSQMELKVDVLFFTAYSFKYDSTEVWRDDKLAAVAVTVDDNGKIVKTTARLEDDLFKIDGPRGSFLASAWVFPTNHWHRGQAISGTVLNTLNGRLAKIEVVHKGLERVQTKQGTIDAEHLQYTGQLRDVDVWYDAANRWVKMTFKARDGSLIEYRCNQCGLTTDQPAAVAGDDGASTNAPPAQQSANDPS